MTTETYQIGNKYDTRTWCGSDNSWVNDGRETAHYPDLKSAASALSDAVKDDETAHIFKTELL